MPATPRTKSIDQLVRDAITPAAGRAANLIARYIASAAADELEARLSRAARRGPTPRGARVRRGRPAGEIDRWVADRRARRVPNFVKAMTGGLDTKKKIVARYGEGAVFARGKAVPRPRAAAARTGRDGSTAVKARPPLVRKAATVAKSG